LSIEAMVWVLYHSPTSGTDKVLLLGIANHADAEGKNAWPAVRTLARYANLEPRGVQKALRRLQSEGHIRIEQQSGGTPEMRSDRRPNRYSVIMDGVSSGTGRQVDGVSSSTERGVPQDANGVSSGTPKPYLEPSLETSSAARPTDDLWDCVVDVFEYSDKLTSLERGRINKALKSLREVGATADEIRARASVYRNQFPNVAFTPLALASNWSQLEPKGRRRSSVERCRDCEQPLTSHDQDLCVALAGGWK
jgi:hypothetical protein